MATEQIQTLHPTAGKTNKRISLEKYNIIRENILAILHDKELTHTELMEILYLEARKMIERKGTKPEKYRFIGTESFHKK